MVHTVIFGALQDALDLEGGLGMLCRLRSGTDSEAKRRRKQLKEYRTEHLTVCLPVHKRPPACLPLCQGWRTRT